MLGELLRNVPITRSPGEVRELLAKDMPVSIVLSPDEILVLNAKRDAYYTVTPEACSCPASVFNPGPCKHRKMYFPEESALEERKAKKQERPSETGSIRNSLPGWCNGSHGPWVE